MHSSQTLSGQVNSQYSACAHGGVESSISRFNAMSLAPNIQILRSRDRYTTCHVRAAGGNEHHWLPAIEVDGFYYSFFRVAKTQARALQISSRLSRQGDRPIITQIPKGYAIWVLEVEPQLNSKSRLQSFIDESMDELMAESASRRPSYLDDPSLSDASSPLEAPSTEEEMLYRVLTSQRQYSKHRVCLPGLDQAVLAVKFEGNFYSLFKTSQDIKQLAQIVRKISQRGDKTVVTRMPQGYGVWIFEPHARPIYTDSDSC